MAGSLDGGGNYGGHIFSTTNGGTATSTTAWTDLASSPVTNDFADSNLFNPGGFDISSLAADPHDATGATIYATVMGFTGNGINAPHLYRSTDSGAHWTNISSNLPNAPANSVLIDPNDANTRLRCARHRRLRHHCSHHLRHSQLLERLWQQSSQRPRRRNSKPPRRCQQATAASANSAPLPMAEASGRSLCSRPQPHFSPAISISPTTVLIRAQAVATASAPQTITVTNTGNAPLIVSPVAATGDFVETDTCTDRHRGTEPHLHHPGYASCPPQPAVAPASSPSTATSPAAKPRSSLTGTGTTAAAIVLNPVTFAFASTLVNADQR